MRHPQELPALRHFAMQERTNANPLLVCWCGATLEVDYSYEAGGTSEGRSRLNQFLDQHDPCQPKEAMPMIHPENVSEGTYSAIDPLFISEPLLPPLLMSSGTVYFPISPTDLDAIRQMVREEVHAALKDIVQQIQRG